MTWRNYTYAVWGPGWQKGPKKEKWTIARFLHRGVVWPYKWREQRYGNYGHEAGVLSTIRSEMAFRFQLKKNYRRRCSNSGVIVLKVRRRSLRGDGNLMSRLNSFESAHSSQRRRRDTKKLIIQSNLMSKYIINLDYHQRISKVSSFFE